MRRLKIFALIAIASPFWLMTKAIQIGSGQVSVFPPVALAIWLPITGAERLAGVGHHSYGALRPDTPPAVAAITWASWLLAMALLVVVSWWYADTKLRRRHLGEAPVFEVTSVPARMNAAETALAGRLESLGFRRLGVLELRPRFDLRAPMWVYVNESGTIRAGIGHRPKIVTFTTDWADGTSTSTASDKLPKQARSRSNERREHSKVDQAYRIHVAAIEVNPNHGPVIPTGTLANAVVAERRVRILVRAKRAATKDAKWAWLIPGLPDVILAIALCTVAFRPF